MCITIIIITTTNKYCNNSCNIIYNDKLHVLFNRSKHILHESLFFLFATLKLHLLHLPISQGQTALVESSSESDEEKKTRREKFQSRKKTSTSEKSPKAVTPHKEDKSKPKKSTFASPAKKEDKKHEKAEKTEGKPKPKFHVNYEFFDAGNHWCRKCNVVSSNVYEVFQHLQKKQHISVSEDCVNYWRMNS